MQSSGSLRKRPIGELLAELDDLTDSDKLQIHTFLMMEAIDNYPVSNIGEVLRFCERLIYDAHVSTVNMGYAVLSKLSQYDEFTAMLRVQFYNAIIDAGRPPRVYATLYSTYLFTDLSRGGKTIEGFIHTLPLTIKNLYDEFILTTTESGTEPPRTKGRAFGVTVPDSLQVLINIIKYNAKYIDDDDITNLLEQMLARCSVAEHEKHSKAISIVDSLIAYTYIPRHSVLTLTRLISFWVGNEYIMLQDAQGRMPEQERIEKYWTTFAWLLSTHLKDHAIDSLLDCLEDDSISYQQARGAALLIRRSLVDVQTFRIVNLDLARLLEALAKPAVGDLLGSACVRLGLIRALLAEGEWMREKFVQELDWTPLQQAIVYNATTPYLKFTNEDDLQCPVPSNPDDRRKYERRLLLSQIIEQIEKLPMTLTQGRSLRKIALSCAMSLDQRQRQKLIEAYEPSAFRISVGNWLPEIHEIARIFITNEDAALADRQFALGVVNGALQRAQELGEQEAVSVCERIILDALASEQHHVFRGNLVHCVISVMSEYLTAGDDSCFDLVADTLLKATKIEATQITTKPGNASFGIHTESESLRTKEFEAVLPYMLPEAGLVVLLMQSSMTHPERARMLFSEMNALIRNEQGMRTPEATVMLMRGLFRVRSDIDHRIFFVASPEGESLAALLNRNTNDPRHSLRRKSVAWDLEEAPPAWKYGDIEGLPQEPPTIISPCLRSDSSSRDCGLDMNIWLKTLLAYINAELEWETYSYIVVHLGAQLSNQSLFTETIPQIKELAKMICNKIQTQKVMKPPEASNLRQGDVAFCLIDILTTIIGYHWHFPRPDTENMISTFIMGLTAWDITTVPCIHGLTLCCYELPVSLSRDLVRIVEKMSTIVTKSDAAIHVLEFLAGLSRLELTSRFHGDEIKTVFGVCFSYIEYARGKRYDEAQQRSSNRSANATRQGSIASGQRPSTEDIPQYVFAISYHVITFWYLTLRREDQKKYLPWMESRLLSRDQAGNVEDEAVVTLDHLWRVAEGRGVDRPAIIPTSSSEEPTSQTWISEYCMLTLSSQQEDGGGNAVVEVIERRASGTDFYLLPCPTDAITPEELFVQLGLADVMNGPFTSAAYPSLLSMTDATKRALGIFDRTSVVDFFKCGVIYIGEGQTEEGRILRNVIGSPDYMILVESLGTKIRLPGHRGNVAGLDTSEGAFDGTYTYQYTDGGVTTLNYHVTTRMPVSEHDPLCTRKKSHIGNDYVNIVFNNSGLVSGFDFHTFPSAFNYVYIVITPEARQTLIQTRTRSQQDPRWYEDSWFKVQLMTREDFPDISSAAETKVVSGEALAAYVRNLALNAEVFCRVWTNRGSGEYPSSWRSRLGQIRQLKDRVEKIEREKAEKEKLDKGA